MYFSVQRWQWLVPHETAVVSAQILCTPQPIQPCTMSLHAKPHRRNVYSGVFSSGITRPCHLHFIGRMTGIFYVLLSAVTRGCNGYRNKSQHRNSTLENQTSDVVEEAAAQAVGGHVSASSVRPCQYLLPDSNSWTRSCAGTWDRSAMIRLDLATDRLVNISYREGSSRPTIHQAFLTTRFTRLFRLVLGGAATRLEARSTARFL